MEEKKTWWQRRGWITVIGGVILLFVISATAGSSSNTSTSTSNNAITANDDETPSAPQTLAQQVCAMTPQQLRSQAKAVSYAQLIKDSDSYQGTITKFTGQILQIKQSGNTGLMRLSVTNLGYGVWSPNDVVYVEYNQSTAAVQGDVVTVYGMLNGTQTYNSEANYQITLPDMVACAIGAIPASTPSSVPARTNSTKQTTNETAASVPAQATVPTPAPKPTYTTPSGAVVDQSGNVVQAPPPSPASWHTVGTFSGQTQKNTPTFTIQGSQWRIEWQETGSDYFGADAESPDGGNYCSIASLVGPGSDSTYCYTPGTYYVSVNTSNSWTIAVQDYY